MIFIIFDLNITKGHISQYHQECWCITRVNKRQIPTDAMPHQKILRNKPLWKTVLKFLGSKFIFIDITECL